MGDELTGCGVQQEERAQRVEQDASAARAVLGDDLLQARPQLD